VEQNSIYSKYFGVGMIYDTSKDGFIVNTVHWHTPEEYNKWGEKIRFKPIDFSEYYKQLNKQL
jgi:hypothetical protein